MAIVLLSVGVTPGSQVFAPIHEAQTVRVSIVARDADTQAPVAATGLRLWVRNPQQSTPVTYSQVQMTEVGVGSWIFDLVLDTPGRWRLRAECDAPRPAAREITVTAGTSGILNTVPTGALLVSPDGEVITTPDARTLTAARMDRLALASGPDNLMLVGTEVGEPRRISSAALRASIAGLVTSDLVGYVAPKVIAAEPGGSYTLTADDNGYTLIWDGAATLPAIVPPDLPIGFQAALQQSGSGQVVVQPASGVVVTNRLGHNATAGAGSVILLVQGAAQSTYSLMGDTGYGATTEAPVVVGQAVTADESWSTGRVVARFAAQRDAGVVAWSITAGNTGGAFAINAEAGVVTLAGALDAGVLDTYSLTVQASNAYGSGTATLAVSVIAASYDPIAAGAAAWFQPRLAEAVGIIDPTGDGTQAYSYILDAAQRGPQIYSATDPIANPRPTLAAAGQFNGLDTASFSAVNSRLIGNVAMRAMAQNIGSLAIEMVVSPIGLAAKADLLAQRLSGTSTLYGVSITPAGRIEVVTRRSLGDALRTVTTAAAVRVGKRHYLYVGIDYSTGLLTVQLDDVIEAFPGTWTNGTGNAAEVVTGAFLVGLFDNISSMRFAELAIYPGVQLAPEARALNRSYLLPVYDLAGTSVPGVPEAVPVVSDVDIDVDDSFLAGRQVWQMRVDNASTAGAVTWAITGGNAAGDFAIAAETGWLSTVNAASHLTTAAYAIEVAATNSLGADAGVLNITVAAAAYNPGALSAPFWGDFSNDAGRQIIDQGGTPAVSDLDDLLGSGRRMSLVASYLAPTLVTQWNGLDVATLSLGNHLLSGDNETKDIVRNTDLVAVEFAIAILTTPTSRDVVRWSNAANSTSRFRLDIVTGGRVRITATRLDTGTSRSLTSVAVVTPGAKNYIYAAVNFGTGELTIQLNDTTETTLVVWDDGLGPCADSRPVSHRLGYTTQIPNMQVAEFAIYKNQVPGPALRAINRGVLMAKWGLV